jgi:AraC-like DNA-binding protein
MANTAFYQHNEKNNDIPIYIKEFEHSFFDFSFHYHSDYEIMLIENGSGKQIVGNSISNYQNSTLLFLGKNLAHGWKSIKKDEADTILTHCIYIQFCDDCLGNDFFLSPEMDKANELLKLSNFGLHITGKCMEDVSVLMKEMVNQKGLSKIITFLRIFETIKKNPEYSLLCESDYSPSRGGKRDKRLQDIYQYLFENFSEEISIDIIAEKMDMSKSAFCHFFKKHTGKSFSLKVNEVRVNQACHFLTSSDISITQICFECGFQSVSYFNKTFKEITGYSPSSYRNEYTKW